MLYLSAKTLGAFSNWQGDMKVGQCGRVSVQREMERERSPLVSNTRPSGGGFSRHLGLPIRCVLGRARKTNFRAHEHRLDEPTRISLSMVASLQSPLPFRLAKSL